MEAMGVACVIARSRHRSKNWQVRHQLGLGKPVAQQEEWKLLQRQQTRNLRVMFWSAEPGGPLPLRATSRKCRGLAFLSILELLVKTYQQLVSGAEFYEAIVGV